MTLRTAISRVFVLAALFVGQPLLAGDTYGVTALLEAAANHPLVALKQNARVVAGHNLDASEWSRYPTFSVEGVAPLDTTQTVTVKLEQPVWTAGRIDAQIETARLGVDVASIEVAETLDQVQSEVISAYAEMWRAQDKIQAADSNIQALTELRGVIERRVTQQVSPESELILVEARLNQARAELAQYQSARLVSASQLRRATRKEVAQVSKLTCNLPEQLSSAEAYQLALDASANLARLNAQRRVLESALDAAQAQRWPTLVAGVQNVSQQGVFGDSDSQVYLGFTYQLTDGLSVNSKIAAAEGDLLGIDYEIEDTQALLKQRVDSLLSNFNSFSDQIDSLGALVDVNASLIESYRRQYIVGKKSWLDVVNAQREVAQARGLLVDAQVNACLNALMLGQLTGRNYIQELSD